MPWSGAKTTARVTTSPSGSGHSDEAEAPYPWFWRTTKCGSAGAGTSFTGATSIVTVTAADVSEPSLAL